LLQVQKRVCEQILALEEEYSKVSNKEVVLNDQERSKFTVDRWDRALGGGGITCILEDGQVFERAGCNVSVVFGTLGKAAITQMNSRGRSFKVPDEVVEHSGTDKEKATWWFGGGSDLTPYVLHEPDVVHFHRELKNAIDSRDKKLFPMYKKWCDDYFVNSHRQDERRGVGGIFFDDHETGGQEESFKFAQACAGAIIPSYFPLVRKNMNKAYDYDDRQWQLIRRGRYVEFNLVHDRGTKFGLYTPNSRIESILMSLPREAKWKYNHVPQKGSYQEKLMEVLRNPKDWI